MFQFFFRVKKLLYHFFYHYKKLKRNLNICQKKEILMFCYLFLISQRSIFLFLLFYHYKKLKHKSAKSSKTRVLFFYTDFRIDTPQITFFTLSKNWFFFQHILVSYPKKTHLPTLQTHTDFSFTMDDLVAQFSELRITPTDESMDDLATQFSQLQDDPIDDLVAKFAKLSISSNDD